MTVKSANLYNEELEALVAAVAWRTQGEISDPWIIQHMSLHEAKSHILKTFADMDPSTEWKVFHSAKALAKLEGVNR